MSYSVLTEPVIHVLMPDGSEKSLGIKDVFLQAHRIKDIGGSNPLERYGVLRLLIAFAMDMLHPETSYDRMDLFQAGRFDADTLEGYIRECEKEGPRFDLFDPDHPFFQSRYEEELDKKAEKPVAVLVHALPSGNNHVFIDHRMAYSHSLDYGEAFRALCASYFFCVSGTAGPSGVNNTPPLVAIAVGKDLFATIILNMISVAEAAPLPYGVGEVPWRKERRIIPRENVAAVSLLEGLTWMPRRITLVPDQERNSVSRVYCQAGLDFRGNDLWNDPHVPRFRKKDNTFGTVKPEIGREVWRDIGTLLYDHDSLTVCQPLALRCLSNMYDEGDIPDWIPLRTAGLITNQAAYTGWAEDELSLPSCLLCNQEKADVFRDDILMAERIQTQIYSCVQRCLDRPRSESPATDHEVASQCQQFFLKECHDLLLGDAVMEIASSMREKEHVDHYALAVKNIIRQMLDQILYKAGNDKEAMMKQIKAEKQIWINYQKNVKEREERYAGS